MKEYEKIKVKIDLVNQLSHGLESYYYKMKDPLCDKHGIGFNLDSRFSSFEIKLSIDSWTGHRGESGCSTFLSFGSSEQKEIFREAFLDVLRVEFNKLMEKTIKKIEREVITEKEKAISNLEKMIEKIQLFGA